MSVPELRVHGVSGTPPRNMLYSDPVRIPPSPHDSGTGDKYVGIYRKPTEDDFGVGRDVNAFHWGGLTSGSWLTALWILLLPFSLANLSGWTARTRSRWTLMWVRLFGLVLTGVFINLAVVASVDIYWQWSATAGPSLLTKNRELWAGLIFLLIGIVWWAMVSVASTRSHFTRIPFRTREALIWSPRTDAMLPPSDGPPHHRRWEDPAGTDITDEAMWGPHSILHRLRRIHFAFGYFALAFSAAAASDSGLKFGGFGLFDVPTAAVAVLLLWNVATLAATSLWRGNPKADTERHRTTQARLLAATAVQPIIGAGVLLGAALLLMLTSVETGSEGNLGHLRDTSAVILFTSGLLLLIVWIKAGKISAAASTFGVFFGLIMGAAATLTLSEPLNGTLSSVDGLNWIAVGILVWLLIGICVVVWNIVGRIDRHGRRELWDAVHETTGDLSSFFVWMPAVALSAAALVIWKRCTSAADVGLLGTCFQQGTLSSVPEEAGILVGALAALAFALTMYLFIKAGRWKIAIGTAAVIVPAFVLLRKGGFEVAGVEISLATVESTARTFAVLLPASLLFGRVVGGFRGGEEARRGTGVIWDVVMFWPRWFHPLAPPAYGPHAVHRLGQEMKDRLSPADSGDRRSLIVSSHSQGTVITTIAVGLRSSAIRKGLASFDLRDPESLDHLGLLTYGCPIRHLYDTYFPSAGFVPLATAIAKGLAASGGAPPLNGRWANLHRPTDPIGGPLIDSIDVAIDDPTEDRNPHDPPLDLRPGESSPTYYRIHSSYEATKEFIEQRDRIRALL